MCSSQSSWRIRGVVLRTKDTAGPRGLASDGGGRSTVVGRGADPWGGPGHPQPRPGPSLCALGPSLPAQLTASQHAFPCEPVLAGYLSFSTPHRTCSPHQEEACIPEPWPGLHRASTHHLCWGGEGGAKQGARFSSLVHGLPPPAFHFPRGLADYVKPLVHAGGWGEACPASRRGSGPSPQPASAPCRHSGECPGGDRALRFVAGEEREAVFGNPALPGLGAGARPDGPLSQPCVAGLWQRGAVARGPQGPFLPQGLTGP